MSMENIEQLAKAHAENRDLLADRLRALQDEIEDAQRRRLRGIRNALKAAAATEVALRNAIEGNPELFQKPRTVVFSGLKLGFQKGKGEVVIADKQRTVRLIGQHLGSQYDELVKTTTTPIAARVAKLPATQLRKIGVEIRNTGDQVVLKPVDSQLDKQVAALLKDAIDEAGEAEQGAAA